MTTTKHIILTPTKEGFVRMNEVFKQQIESSRKKIARAESLIENTLENTQELDGEEASLVEEALELLIQQEEKRIGHMEDGINECAKALTPA